MLLVMLGWPAAAQSGNTIFVTTLQQKITTTGGCSLQEAIYSADLHNNLAIDATDPDNFITTQCVAGTGNDTIVLPTGGVFNLSSFLDGDAYNPFGPTATPIIFSNITIEGNGSTLQWVGSQNVRLFAVGPASISTPGGTVSGTGNLTLRNVYIKGFRVKGGDGSGFGGGGMGAGGAVYLQDGGLTVENSTFDGNGAVGGNGSGLVGADGGGGLFGNGGGGGGGDGGAGGGGAKGNGGSGFVSGGGGGGTIFSGRNADAGGVLGGPGGLLCGGNGGDTSSNGNDGHDGKCPGGGGGGGGSAFNPINPFTRINGGNGGYGGGGGGGGNDNGGNGGFGGGGGGGSNSGGDGGFGGGGGGGGKFVFGGGGKGGSFAGDGGDGCCGSGRRFGGGGGAALGGAVFNDSGTVTIRNSTFTNNFVTRGQGGALITMDLPAANGADAGAAIFSRNGLLTVVDSTISGNSGTGSGAGIVAIGDSIFAASLLVLNDTIIANNGANECYVRLAVTTAGAGNLIMSNGTGDSFGACPGVVATGDPLLAPLQLNNGNTPTMAITSNFSSAFGTADAATSLPTDQRAVARPQSQGFDIGAYQACSGRLGIIVCPLLIAPPGNTEPLTIQVSPAAGGTVSPPSGDYALNSVVILRAMANPGYSFINWTGAVADLNNPLTTVTMNQPQAVTANFVAQPTTMAGNIIAKSGPQNARVWTLSLLDNGPGGAFGTAITSFTLTQVSGTACTPVIGTAPPLAVGDLAPAQTGTANLTIDFTGCAAAARFTAKFTYSANGGTVSGFVIRYNQYQ